MFLNDMSTAEASMKYVYRIFDDRTVCTIAVGRLQRQSSKAIQSQLLLCMLLSEKIRMQQQYVWCIQYQIVLIIQNNISVVVYFFSMVFDSRQPHNSLWPLNNFGCISTVTIDRCCFFLPIVFAMRTSYTHAHCPIHYSCVLVEKRFGVDKQLTHKEIRA